MAFEYRLVRGLFDDELGRPRARVRRRHASLAGDDRAARQQPTSQWWDDITTPDRVETRDDIVAAALDEAGA